MVASPFAKKLAKDHSIDITSLIGTGPNGRILSTDVLNRNLKPSFVPVPSTEAIATIIEAPAVTAPMAFLSDAIYQDFIVTDAHKNLANRFVHSKLTVPHYYLSVELNLEKLLKLRDELNLKTGSKLSVGLLDLLVKATAVAMKQVPDVNGSWFETFVRRYEQVF